jgi:hypothetical protein
MNTNTRFRSFDNFAAAVIKGPLSAKPGAEIARIMSRELAAMTAASQHGPRKPRTANPLADYEDQLGKFQNFCAQEAGHKFHQSLAIKFENLKVAMTQRDQWQAFCAQLQPDKAATAPGK